ncbi:MAG: hypothetical protein JRJ65_14260, partial [Deltaproteobacteria bacterium]|nr:hypothetical protein [Deltaproteobacteria bacterium]
MKLRIWTYLFKHAFENIFSNRLIHIISIGTISISILLFGAFILLFVNFNNLILEWGQSLSMSVYLKDGTDKETKNRIESILINLPGAQIKGFISKEKAMIDLMEALGDQVGLLDSLT